MIAQLGASNRAIGATVNVGNDQEIAIKDLAELVRQRARSSSKIRYLSFTEAYGEDFVDVERRRPDLTHLRELIEFTPSWALAATIDQLIAEQRHEYTSIAEPDMAVA